MPLQNDESKSCKAWQGTNNIWPYAIKMKNDAINTSSNAQLTGNPKPMTEFTKSEIAANPVHWHHFGCPAYVLAEPLQGGTGIYHKCQERRRIGVYLGKSPQHAKNLASVLSLSLVQFHLNFMSS